jgi:hypothetical protein
LNFLVSLPIISVEFELVDTGAADFCEQPQVEIFHIGRTSVVSLTLMLETRQPQ